MTKTKSSQHVQIVLSQDSLRTFKSLLNEKTEVAGSMKYKKKKTKTGYVYVFDIDQIQQEDSLNEVSPIYSDFSFHTHPKIAYDNFKTNIGWPSISDYFVLLEFESMKGHIVISKEGLWIITFHQDYLNVKDKMIPYQNKLEKKLKSFLKSILFDKSNLYLNETNKYFFFQLYCDIINNFTFKKRKIFKIALMKW